MPLIAVLCNSTIMLLSPEEYMLVHGKSQVL